MGLKEWNSQIHQITQGIPEQTNETFTPVMEYGKKKWIEIKLMCSPSYYELNVNLVTCTCVLLVTCEVILFQLYDWQ